MFVRLKKHRPYQYEPRFYRPDVTSKERKPIRFRRSRRKNDSLSVVFIVAAIALIFYVLHLLSQLANH
jgi:hypothetical protein